MCERDTLLFARNDGLGSVQLGLISMNCQPQRSVALSALHQKTSIEETKLNIHTYQMVSKLQWSQRCDEDQVDKVWRDLRDGRRCGRHRVLYEIVSYIRQKNEDIIPQPTLSILSRPSPPRQRGGWEGELSCPMLKGP
jgi:hypothetical protein